MRFHLSVFRKTNVSCDLSSRRDSFAPNTGGEQEGAPLSDHSLHVPRSDPSISCVLRSLTRMQLDVFEALMTPCSIFDLAFVSRRTVLGGAANLEDC